MDFLTVQVLTGPGSEMFNYALTVVLISTGISFTISLLVRVGMRS